MRILHLSDDGLPDWRVEKAALTAKKNGHDVFFGGRLNSNSHSTAFSEIYPIKWNAAALIGIPYYYHLVKKQIARLVKLVRPDVVHSHNIGSAKVSHELGLPFVFDDHEYFGMLSLVNAENMKFHDSTHEYSGLGRTILRLKLGFISRRSISNWTKWEKELVSSVTTITVSEQIAHDLSKLRAGSTKDIFVVPNFPLQIETTEFSQPQPHEKLSCVYAGVDSKFPRKKMFFEMTQNSIGLIPWKKHWSHPFLNPNKAYEYAHAGLFVMLTSDLTSVIHTLGDNCLTFENYDDLALKLQYFKTNVDELYEKRVKVFNSARQNLVWEKHEKNIIEAYKSV